MKRAAEIVLDCLGKKDMSQRQLAAGMGEDVRYLNQQLRRQNDMKVGRFADVLDHIGYSIDVVDNNGIRKVCDKYASRIIEEGGPKGLFWTMTGDYYTAIDSRENPILQKSFRSKEECFRWLLRPQE